MAPAQCESGEEQEREAEFVAALVRGTARGIVRVLPKAAMGVAEEACAFPFEVARTQLQTGSHDGNSLDVIRHIWKHEGLRGLFRGVSIPIGTGILQSTVLFGAYGTVREALGDDERAASAAAAGAAAGAASAVVTSPSELVVRRMHHENQGALQCLRGILRSGGLPALYRGISLTAARDVGGYAAFFAVYEDLKRRLGAGGEEGAPVSVLSVVLAAGTASAAYSASTYPIDVVKTNVQLKPDQYRGAMDCARALFALHGWRGFYRGLPSTAAHAFPANALGFVCYELVTQALGEHGGRTNPHAHHW